jgi:anaerobic magnesium-protoporphyrin IX monomethyl ester cyclase
MVVRKKRKIVFTQPTGYNWVHGETDITRDVNIMAPVGLCSMASYLARRGVESRILDGYAHPRSLESWVSIILDERPDFVGIGTTTSSFLEGIRLAQALKRAAPSVRTVFGGAHISSLKEQCLRDFPAIDYGVVGEGEEALHELLVRDGRDLDDVEGILHRPDGRDSVAFTGHRKTQIRLDDLPFPAYDKLEDFPSAYNLPIFSFPDHPTASVISSRGCPYQCSYCDRSVFKRGFRYNSPEYMHALLVYLGRRWGIRHVTFYDDIFTANRKRVEAFCDLMARRPPGMTFSCAVRANQLDDGLLVMLRAAGCWQISFGVESGDPDIVKVHRKQTDLDDIREKVDLIHKRGIRVKGLFIVGLPGETEETVRRSMDYALGTDFDEINVSKFTPFPGAPVYGNIRELGEFDEDWSKMNLLNFVFVPRGLTKAKLEDLYRDFIRRFYQRPHIMARYTRLMIQSPFNLVLIARSFGDFLRYIRWLRRG